MSIEHPHIVAGPLHLAKPGECAWLFHAFGVWLHCGDPAVPGEEFCAEHYIEAVNSGGPRRRVFPPRPVDVPPVITSKETAK